MTLTLDQAKALVTSCEADLDQTLTRGQMVDLLLDNWDYEPDWTDATAEAEHALAVSHAEAIVAERAAAFPGLRYVNRLPRKGADSRLIDVHKDGIPFARIVIYERGSLAASFMGSASIAMGLEKGFEHGTATTLPDAIAWVERHANRSGS